MESLLYTAYCRMEGPFFIVFKCSSAISLWPMFCAINQHLNHLPLTLEVTLTLLFGFYCELFSPIQTALCSLFSGGQGIWTNYLFSFYGCHREQLKLNALCVILHLQWLQSDGYGAQKCEITPACSSSLSKELVLRDGRDFTALPCFICIMKSSFALFSLKVDCQQPSFTFSKNQKL